MTTRNCCRPLETKAKSTMRAQKNVVVVALISIFLSSCAFQAHTVRLQPTVPVEYSSEGRNVIVELQVFDEREDTVVGQRGAGTMGADITVADLVPTVERELKKGLEARGFTVANPGQKAGAELEAKIRAFKFYVETGFWTGAENTSVVISVEAKKHGFDYDRTYRTGSEERIIVISEGATIDQKLNAALDEVLTSIIRDENLMKFLAAE